MADLARGRQSGYLLSQGFDILNLKILNKSINFTSVGSYGSYKNITWIRNQLQLQTYKFQRV